MSGTPANDWRDLFSHGPGDGTRVLGVLRKGGREFLILPREARQAARALELYPAQTGIARIARALLRVALLCKLPIPLEIVPVQISSGSPFVKFLKRLSGSADVPVIAILCGNPRSPGRRFITLVFDKEKNPVSVVKAGIGGDAEDLVGREIAFLKAVPPGTIAIPPLREELQADGIQCLALDFVDGASPSGAWSPAEVLGGWVNQDSPVPIASIPIWQRLASACGDNTLFARIAAQLEGKTARTTIQHGDFTPWNIKLSHNGFPTVLDWERGEMLGMPAWDWFHYVVQTGILVRRSTVERLVACLDDLCASPAFKQYAALTGIEGSATGLLLAYLVYCVEVLKPADSLTETRALLEALQKRGLK